MTLVRFDPFSVLRDFDRLAFGPVRSDEAIWMPRVDVVDEADGFLVRAEVPGVEAESIDVSVEDAKLTIAGSRGFETESENGSVRRKEIFEGSFRRSINLPKSVDAEAITATSVNGMLEISVPKRAEVLPRKVTVDVQR